MTSHNRASLIGDSIASVLRQTLADFELIVIDDGSVDDSVSVIRGFDDPRIDLVCVSACSVSHARNVGIERARGEFITFLDCDDLYAPDYLARQVACLAAHPGAQAVYAMGQEFDERGLRASTRGYPMRYPGDAFRSMLYNDFTCSIAVLARTAAIKASRRFEPAMEPSEDRAFWTWFALGREMVFNEAVLAHIRCHEGNISGAASPRFQMFLRGHIRVLDAVAAETNLPAGIREELPRFYRNAGNGGAFLAWCTGHRALAWRLAIEGMRRSGMPLSALAQLAWYVLMRRGLYRFALGRRLARKALEWRRTSRPAPT